MGYNRGLVKSVEKRVEEKEKNIKKAYEIVINAGSHGISAKELGAEMHLSAESGRVYLNTLLERGLINHRKEGKARVFVTNDASSDTSKEMAVNHSGKEFAPGSYIPCSNVCKPGDVVWVSSRSGEGAFFRYLIITPWEHKAMCLGIFEEGHPKLDLNDPYYVCIGEDPEKHVKLYADLRNNCQRGYRQFGERVMHVDEESFGIVKYRLARSMGIDRTPVEKKVVNDQTVELNVKITKLENKIKELEEDNNDLRTERDTALKQVDEAHVGWDQANRLATQFSNDVNELSTLNATLRDKLTKAEAENNELKKQKTVDGPTQRNIGQIVVANKVNEALKERYEDEIKTLRQVIFSMIKGGDAK